MAITINGDEERVSSQAPASVLLLKKGKFVDIFVAGELDMIETHPSRMDQVLLMPFQKGIFR